MKEDTIYQAWAAKARLKLNEIAEGAEPDAAMTNHGKAMEMRVDILKLRNRFSWTRIAEFLAQPGIGVKVRASTLQRWMRTKRRKGRPSGKRSAAATRGESPSAE